MELLGKGFSFFNLVLIRLNEKMYMNRCDEVFKQNWW